MSASDAAMLARCVAAHAALGVNYVATRKWHASSATTAFVLEPPLAMLVSNLLFAASRDDVVRFVSFFIYLCAAIV